MNGQELAAILEAHSKWVCQETDGRKANFQGADLQGAYFLKANLLKANFQEANLREANLRGANLQGTNFQGANLRDADLWGAYLRDANLQGANLSGADLQEANLSGVVGLLNASEWLKVHFQIVDAKCLVYKAMGDTRFSSSAPTTWEIAPGAELTEVVNPCRTVDCGCGVNFATLDWLRGEYAEEIASGDVSIWRAELDLCKNAGEIVVPYSTDGKARCAHLKLLEELLGGLAMDYA